MACRSLSAFLVALLGLAASSTAATFTVVNTDDSGAGSLRQAILDANSSPGTDTVTFNMPGSGVHTIQPSTVLPAVTDAVTIDGYTQPGANPNTLVAGDNAVLLIEIDGTNLGAGASGISVTAGPATIRGLVINRCVLGAASISLSGGTGHVVAGNFIGADATGTVGLPNAPNGVVVSASNCAIGGADTASRNVIATHTERDRAARLGSYRFERLHRR